jgi:hypothetical protein
MSRNFFGLQPTLTISANGVYRPGPLMPAGTISANGVYRPGPLITNYNQGPTMYRRASPPRRSNNGRRASPPRRSNNGRRASPPRRSNNGRRTSPPRRSNNGRRTSPPRRSNNGRRTSANATNYIYGNVMNNRGMLQTHVIGYKIGNRSYYMNGRPM